MTIRYRPTPPRHQSTPSRSHSNHGARRSSPAPRNLQGIFDEEELYIPESELDLINHHQAFQAAEDLFGNEHVTSRALEKAMASLQDVLENLHDVNGMFDDHLAVSRSISSDLRAEKLRLERQLERINGGVEVLKSLASRHSNCKNAFVESLVQVKQPSTSKSDLPSGFALTYPFLIGCINLASQFKHSTFADHGLTTIATVLRVPYLDDIFLLKREEGRSILRVLKQTELNFFNNASRKAIVAEYVEKDIIPADFNTDDAIRGDLTRSTEETIKVLIAIYLGLLTTDFMDKCRQHNVIFSPSLDEAISCWVCRSPVTPATDPSLPPPPPSTVPLPPVAAMSVASNTPLPDVAMGDGF